MSVYWFDLIAFSVLLAAAFFSWRKGFVREALRAAGWVAGYFAAALFYERLSAVLKPYLKFAPVCDMAAFLLVFFAGYLAVRLVDHLLQEKLGLKAPRVIDGPAGALMGILKFVFFLAIALLPLNMFPSAKRTLLEKSYIAAGVFHVSGLAGDRFGIHVPTPEKIREELADLKEKVPSVTEIQDELEKIPGSLKEKAVSAVPAKPVPRQKSPKTTPPLPSPEKNIPASAMPPMKGKGPAMESKKTPDPVRIKKIDPVIKNRPADPTTDDERKRMDEFIGTLN